VSIGRGPARALALIDALEARGGLKGYELMPASAPICCGGSAGMGGARAYLAQRPATQLEPLRRLLRAFAELGASGSA